jgi:predicted nucleic acid-binding protein
MKDRAFFDTNILVYAFSNDAYRKEIAIALFDKGGVVGVQTLNEFVNVAVRKLAVPWDQIDDWLSLILTLSPEPVPVTYEVHSRAVQIMKRYRYGIYDSLVIAAALEADCDILYSEDMQNGQMIDGMTIRDPFRLDAPAPEKLVS